MTPWRILLLASLLLPALSRPGTAQTQPAPAAAPAAPASAVSSQQAQQALSVLRDDARRNEMIGVLETLAKAAPATAPAATVPAATTRNATPAAAATAPTPATAAATTAKLPLPLAPDSLGAELLVGASSRLERLSAVVVETVRSLTNFTLLARWITTTVNDPDSRAEVLDATWKLLVVAGVGLGLEHAAARPMRRPIRALLAHHFPEKDAGSGSGAAAQRQRRRRAAVMTLRRVPLAVARLLLDLLPVMVAGAAGYALLTTRLGEPSTTRLVILALLDAYLLWRAIVIGTRAVVSPEGVSLRLLPINDAMAAAILRWVRRLAAVALFGYAVTEVALLFGLYRVAHDALLRLVALVVHLMLVIIVLKQRMPVARAIRPRPDQTGVVARLRAWIAPVWYIIVIFYIVALWVVWALDVPGGFQRLLLVFLYTAVITNGARLMAVLLVVGLEHLVVLDSGTVARLPGLDSTLRRYVPLLRVAIELVVGAVAVILLFWAWGIDSLAWFSSDALGSRLVSAIVTSALTIGVGLLVWEGSNALVQNHLGRLSREGQMARSARIRTLLPMLQTTLLVTIVLFAGLTVLSEIGVNIAPLLAGAGVVGLAIGFGSQKLVQDIITGLFLLLENTMQVGDVVTLAGMTGTVENLSIRTIRLRALDGAVHIVPFSAVTTVTNMTRDFAYAMLDVSVGLNEEPDHIAEVLSEVAEVMRGEPRWGAAITDAMEILGVEKFIDTAWVLRCRLKTVPSQRWAVARELNRRFKYRFDELAIESPFTSYRALAAAAPPPPNAKTVEEA